MFDALRERGITTALVMFEGEQHGFRQAPNIRWVIYFLPMGAASALHASCAGGVRAAVPWWRAWGPARCPQHVRRAAGQRPRNTAAATASVWPCPLLRRRRALDGELYFYGEPSCLPQCDAASLMPLCFVGMLLLLLPTPLLPPPLHAAGGQRRCPTVPALRSL